MGSHQSLHCPTWRSPDHRHRYLVRKQTSAAGTESSLAQSCSAGTAALLEPSWRLTKVVSIVVPALVAPTALLLIQPFLSVFIVLLPQVFVLQHLIGSIDLQEPVVGGRVALEDRTTSLSRGVRDVRGSLAKRLTGFLSGCMVSANFLKACLISRTDASLDTRSSW